MTLKALSFANFRNLQPGKIEPVPGVNVIHGDNAQGKTNLLEAIWLFTGTRSFRGARDAELIAFGTDQARLALSFETGERDMEAKICIESGRRLTLNDVPLAAPSEMAGVFCAVVFAPGHLGLVRDGPQERRRFLDAAICQIYPRYAKNLMEYTRILKQRNALLKDIPLHSELLDSLPVWDTHLCSVGGRVFETRLRYTSRLSVTAAEIYAGLTGEKETLSAAYHSPVAKGVSTAEAYAGAMAAALHDSRRADLEAGYTTVGPHRDDLTLHIDGLPAKIYGSQGQQRSVVLALKLAEASLLGEVSGERPVALLDDIMSELDPGRQDYILNHIGEWQVFITCCDPAPMLRLTGGRAFSVKGGCVTSA